MQLPGGLAAGPDLGPLMQGGLQRKVARFGELVNSLRRNQEMRGAGSSWGRQEGPLSRAPRQASQGSIPRSGSSSGSDSSSWERALNVTRVQRRDGQLQPQGGRPLSRAAPLLQQQQRRRRQPQEQQSGLPEGPRSSGPADGERLPIDDTGLDW